MKDKFTAAVIVVLVLIVGVIPFSLYVLENYSPGEPQSVKDYCRANGFREVFGCNDGSFKAIRENFAEGFRQVQPDGSFKDCPFTLPQYQEGECLDYVVPGFCTDDDICTYENPCLSAVDCPFGHACIDWQCS